MLVLLSLLVVLLILLSLLVRQLLSLLIRLLMLLLSLLLLFVMVASSRLAQIRSTAARAVFVAITLLPSAMWTAPLSLPSRGSALRQARHIGSSRNEMFQRSFNCVSTSRRAALHVRC